MMNVNLNINGEQYTADLHQAIDISIPVSQDQGASAWYVDPPIIEPVRTEHFLGSVKEGGNVNFRNIFFNPHGHGTHTECVGHISEEVYSINKSLNRYFFESVLISVTPEKKDNGDLIISKEELVKTLKNHRPEALLIRSLPNHFDKKVKNYSDSNPPYFSIEAMEYIVEIGVEHLLIDLPSVDREKDDGVLACHHIFWEYPAQINTKKSITEFIFVPDEVKDGMYLLNLQIAPIENDASPSRPVLYKLNKDS